LKVSAALTSLGAVAGIWYGVSQRKSFWSIAGFAILFSVGGAALGTVYGALNDKK